MLRDLPPSAEGRPLATQDSGLRTQDSGLRTQDSSSVDVAVGEDLVHFGHFVAGDRGALGVEPDLLGVARLVVARELFGLRVVERANPMEAFVPWRAVDGA